MGKYFYDIHFHAMNMSHPNFVAILKRFEHPLFKNADRFLKNNRLKTFFGANYLLAQFSFFKTFDLDHLLEISKSAGMEDYPNRALNLLAIMENDLGNFFLMLEDCIKDHIQKDGQVIIGNQTYTKVILTPLIIDFGIKHTFYTNIHYNQKPVNKPVTDQMNDLLEGIKYYKNKSHYQILEIYPFLGINPRNYTFDEMKEMLEGYFGDFHGLRNSLFSNMGKYTGDINSLKSNVFAGIKVYPLLGFDPWPSGHPGQLKKVEYLYSFCMEKQIPITSHCSDEGFCTISKKELSKLASPKKWEMVLSHYGQLKLNIAHFGRQDNSKEWQKMILKLIQDYEQVYTDISYRGFNDEFYKELRDMADNQKDKSATKKLIERILFGSDFMINLLKTDSYCNYFNLFSQTKYLSEYEKDHFCCINPERFLFKSK